MIPNNVDDTSVINDITNMEVVFEDTMVHSSNIIEDSQLHNVCTYFKEL